MLVPFLIFAIGVSHGAQKMNGIQQDVGRGTVTLVAARYTFRRLFVAGVTALLNGAAGFAVLLLIPIPAIRELAIAATIGVCVLLFTNLVLLPVILSITGVSRKAAARSLKQEEQGAGTKGVWEFFNHFADRKSWAAAAVLVALALGIGGHVVSQASCRSATSIRVRPSCARIRATTSTTPSSPRTSRCRPTCSR